MSHSPFDLHEIHLAGTATAMDPATLRKAALYVAGRARDTDDARLLLTALGLIPDAEAKITREKITR